VGAVLNVVINRIPWKGENSWHINQLFKELAGTFLIEFPMVRWNLRSYESCGCGFDSYSKHRDFFP